MVSEVFGRVSWVSGRVASLPGPILESVFLWRVSVDRNLPVLIYCPGGGSGLPFYAGDRGVLFWADSGPDPGGNIS